MAARPAESFYHPPVPVLPMKQANHGLEHGLETEPNPYPNLVRLIDARIERMRLSAPKKNAPEIASKVFEQISRTDRDWFCYLQILQVARERIERHQRVPDEQ
jgi:hypothetical protein